MKTTREHYSIIRKATGRPAAECIQFARKSVELLHKHTRFINGNPNWTGGTIVLDCKDNPSFRYDMDIYIPVKDGSMVLHQVYGLERGIVPECIALRELRGLGIEYRGVTESAAYGQHKFGRSFDVWHNGECLRSERPRY